MRNHILIVIAVLVCLVWACGEREVVAPEPKPSIVGMWHSEFTEIYEVPSWFPGVPPSYDTVEYRANMRFETSGEFHISIKPPLRHEWGWTYNNTSDTIEILAGAYSVGSQRLQLQYLAPYEARPELYHLRVTSDSLFISGGFVVENDSIVVLLGGRLADVRWPTIRYQRLERVE